MQAVSVLYDVIGDVRTRTHEAHRVTWTLRKRNAVIREYDAEGQLVCETAYGSAWVVSRLGGLGGGQ